MSNARTEQLLARPTRIRPEPSSGSRHHSARTRIGLALALSLLAVAPATAQRKKKLKRPKKAVACVNLQKDWKKAVERARLLQIPIVVHSHKLDDRDSWKLHETVLQSKKYIRFAKKSCLDVVIIDELESFAEKVRGDLDVDEDDLWADQKLEEHEQLRSRLWDYEGRDAFGRKGRYLVYFPGMTIVDLKTLAKSSARDFNYTDSHPFTIVVNPFSLGEVKALRSVYKLAALIKAVEAAKAAITKERGEPKIRPHELLAWELEEQRAEHQLGRGIWRRAHDVAQRFAKKASTWPKELEKRRASLAQRAADSAKAQLAKLGRKLEGDADAQKEAKAELTKLAKAYRGTPWQKGYDALRKSAKR